LRALRATDLAEQLGHVGIDWSHAPIRDFDAPDAAFERLWRDLAPGLHALLAGGRRLLLHCRYGVGRSGTIAARLLVESGTAPAEAIRLVRAAQPGAIETAGQEAFVSGLR
jgi:protein-tyrosine phosphatase